MLAALWSQLIQANTLFLTLLAQADKNTKRPDESSSAVGAIMGDWMVWVLVIALLGLIGLLFFLRNRREE